MSKHTDFILSPITSILKEIVSANRAIGNGIETYPLSEYIMQSVFLKMTGFQEQKMKCICWELATDDYEYRYKRYSKNPLGECSSYQDKKEIYKDLTDLIKKLDPDFVVTTALDRSSIRISTLTEMKDILERSNLSSWSQNVFYEFITDTTLFPLAAFATAQNLFDNDLQDKYKLLYNHRNRCAHNTLSYQENLPTLTSLFKINHKDDNYFVRFALLILLDKIFIELYQKYILVLTEN